MPQKTGFASWTLHRQSIGVLQAKKRQPNPAKPLPLSGQHRDDSALTSANCADWQQHQPLSQSPPSLNIVMERFVCRPQTSFKNLRPTQTEESPSHPAHSCRA
jgi:hypothetical protein